MPSASRIACTLFLLAAAVACDGDDDDGSSSGGCTYESCQAFCEELHAPDLEDCGDICGVESHCWTTGECECSFYPCYDAACLTWCLENSEEDEGGCGDISGNELSCDCY